MAWPLRAFGVPLHPLLVHFPVALWLTAPMLTALALAFGPQLWWGLSMAATALGVAIGVPTLISGLFEYARLSGAGVEVRLAAKHGVRTSAAWGLFVVKLAIAASLAPSTLVIAVALALDAIACAILSQGVVFGTRLIYQHMAGGNDD